MAVTFTKLFSSLTTSTIWREDDYTRLIWITMLAMADKHGQVISSVPGLADMARVSLENTVKSLEKLSSPDPWSNSPEFEGRRIEKIDRGWRLLNYIKFRTLRDEEERRAYKTAKQREYRSKYKKVDKVVDNVAESGHNADADAEVKQNQGQAPWTPNDLHPLNYAAKILEELAFPHTKDNLQVVAAAIEAEVRSGKSKESAFQFVLAGSLDAKDQGLEINRFFFADAKYRGENRGKNGNGNSKAVQRAINNRAAIIEGFGGNADALRTDAGPGLTARGNPRLAAGVHRSATRKA